MACWDMEDGGMLVDENVRVRHLCDLETREAILRSQVLSVAQVKAAVVDRVAVAEEEVAMLERARLAERDERKAAGAKVGAFTHAKQLSKMRLRYRALASEAFNPGSPQQCKWLLYDVFALPEQRKRRPDGTWGVSTDKNAIAALLRLKNNRKGKPISDEVRGVLGLLREIGHLEQLRTTFVVAAGRAPLEADRKHRLMRTQIGLHRTATGRTASGADADEKAGESDTNGANWPVAVRDMVVPSAGKMFVQADWSQVEWLLALYFAEDWASWDRAIAGEDAHRRVASVLYGVAYDAVTPEQRTMAKKVRHALTYGSGVPKIANFTGLSIAMVEQVIAANRAAFPMVAAWQQRTVDLAYRQRYLETPFGWRRWFLGPQADVPKILAFTSATAADMMKVRMPGAAALARQYGGRLVTTTFDSMLCEVNGDQGTDAAAALKQHFERSFVTLGGRSFPATVKVGPNWQAVS